MLKIGDTAPDFSLKDQFNEVQTLNSKRGQWVLIYFYPKDDTPGCTKEACTIAEVYDDFKKLNVNVFGVSKDTVASHKKFAAKYDLPFLLLSDETMTMMDEYGAKKEKSMFGRSVRGTNRISYLIDPAGQIAKVYPEVDPANHALELLQDIKTIKGEYSD